MNVFKILKNRIAVHNKIYGSIYKICECYDYVPIEKSATTMMGVINLYGIDEVASVMIKYCIKHPEDICKLEKIADRLEE